MRQAFLLILLFILASCEPTVEGTQNFEAKLSGKWILTDQQAAGIGPPGIWSTANPAGRWFQLNADSTVSGTVFKGATRYTIIDSATFRIINPTAPAGFELYNFKIDTIEKALFFYIRPPNGGYCFEGCGTLKFKKL